MRHLLSQLNPAYMACRMLFFVLGVTFASWAAMIPFVKTRLAINEAELGLLVFCLGVGSLIFMPLTGALVRRFGPRVVIALSVIVGLTLLIPLSFVVNVALMGCCVALFGSAMGVIDVATNIQSVALEKRDRKNLLAGFYGFYSLGGIAGACAMSALLNLGISPLGCAAVLIVLCLIISLPAFKHSLSRVEEESTHAKEQKARALTPVVVMLGVLCFLTYLAEGTIMDWSAVYLIDVASQTQANAAMGFALFSAAVAFVRFFGDRLIARMGRPMVLIVGSLVGAVSLAVLATGVAGVWAYVPIAVLGAAIANISPVLFSMAAEQKEVPLSAALSAVTAIGYSGVLVGPTLIGFVAHTWSLPAAFGLSGVLLLSVVGGAVWLARRD